MVKGTDVFKRYFKEYSEQYVLIGGTACDLLMEDENIELKQLGIQKITKDEALIMKNLIKR